MSYAGLQSIDFAALAVWAVAVVALLAVVREAWPGRREGGGLDDRHTEADPRPDRRA